MGYENILLKLSGASISDVNDPFSFAKIDAFITKIKRLVKDGKHVAIVVGGGNIWRGKNGPEFFMDPDTADYLGMTSTIYNCEVLSSMFKKRRVKHRVYSALKLEHVTKKYDIAKAKSYLDKGYVVILAGGTGKVGCSTDTASSLRASELGIDAVLVLKNGTDGVYDKDPNKYDDAKKFDYICYDEYIKRDLKAVDVSAVEICKKENIKMIVFDADNLDNIDSVVSGGSIGTTIGG